MHKPYFKTNEKDYGSPLPLAVCESFVAQELRGREFKGVKWMPINDLALQNMAELG
jgi:hypothetical protein